MSLRDEDVAHPLYVLDGSRRECADPTALAVVHFGDVDVQPVGPLRDRVHPCDVAVGSIGALNAWLENHYRPRLRVVHHSKNAGVGAAIITGYRLEVSPAALGLPVTAFARIRPTAGQLPRIAELAAQLPEVTECHRITGEAYATETDFSSGANTWYATIPAPGASMVIAFGVLAVRRRR